MMIRPKIKDPSRIVLITCDKRSISLFEADDQYNKDEIKIIRQCVCLTKNLVLNSDHKQSTTATNDNVVTTKTFAPEGTTI